MIRVLLVTDTLAIGGTETQCVRLAAGLDRSRYAVEAVTWDRGGPLGAELARAGIPLTEFRMGRGFYSPRSLAQILRLARFMKEKKFDVVQTFNFYSTVPAVLAAKIAGTPAVIAGRRGRNASLSEFQCRVEALLWKACDKVVANSAAIKNEIVQGLRAGPEKIAVIHNGIERELLDAPPPPRAGTAGPTVGIVANLRKEKDHATFLEAARAVLDAVPDAKFLIVGEGPLEAGLREKARALGVDRAVVFCGRVTGRKLAETVRGFSVSVISSTSESLPNAALESMACGVPVVASDVGGLSEAVEDGVTGHLFPAGRADVLAEKIVALLRHPDDAVRMGMNGRRKAVEEFHEARMIREFSALYDALTVRRARVLSTAGLPAVAEGGVRLETTKVPSRGSALYWLGLHVRSLRYDALMLHWPTGELYFLCLLRALTPFCRTRLIVLDFIAKKEETGALKGPRRSVKRALLRRVDLFLQLAKDSSGYEKYYGIPAAKCRYVPWKVNGYELALKADTSGRGYVVSAGDSQRDYATLLEAVRGLDLPVKILCSRSGRKRHVDDVWRGEVPSNVSFNHDGTMESWIRHIAAARFMVVCIDPHAINAAGTGTFVTAMALKKCVIVTDCPAARGVLVDGENAVVVPAGDPAALRSAVLRAWNDDAWREGIAANGYRYAISLGGEERFYENVARTSLAYLSGFMI